MFAEKLFIIFYVLLCGLIVFKGYKQHQEIISNVQIVDCKLLNKSLNGFTLKRFITIFDCGTYGTIVSENEDIFRLAKDGENKLEISFYKNLINQNTYRIFGLNN